ncbi:MAG: hypothetical protein BroJett012_06900 [Betaproteobacteria bacterium]|nr:hypothetical protein [Rhodocyclaceae bacterium]GIK44787.1 MAG: hypothetical protein BroJett012_06900 [Betaproteobacteria bacterium]
MSNLEQDILDREFGRNETVIDAEVTTPSRRRKSRKLVLVMLLLAMIAVMAAGVMLLRPKSGVSSAEIAEVMARASMPQQAPKADAPVGAPAPVVEQPSQPATTSPPPAIDSAQQSPGISSPAPLPASQEPVSVAPTAIPATPSAATSAGGLDKEIAEIKVQLAARDSLISDLTKEIAKLKSEAKTPAQPKAAAKTDVSPARPKEIVASMTELGIIALLNDGIVVRSDAGEDVPISVGRVSKKFGKIVKVDPEAKVLVTEARIYKLR